MHPARLRGIIVEKFRKEKVLSEDKRAHDRTESLNITAFEVVSGGLPEGFVGMGRTLDVSKGGILLETQTEVPKGTILTLDIAVKDEIIKKTGEVVHSKPAEEGAFSVGVKFQEPLDFDPDLP